MDVHPLSVVSLVNKYAQWRESFHSLSDTERAACARIVDVWMLIEAAVLDVRVYAAGNLSSRD